LNKSRGPKKVIQFRENNNEGVRMEKLKILFLCTGNSCRSQMAEGWTRHLKGNLIEPYSAGVEPHGLDPRAVKAMEEVGIDISQHRSKDVSEVEQIDFDYVITVCDRAHESCPFFPAKTKVVHVGFDDPPRLAVGCSTEEEAIVHYRRVRDEIKAFVEKLPEVLGEQ
jgi:arsenate reductase (thioredoxin)